MSDKGTSNVVLRTGGSASALLAHSMSISASQRSILFIDKGFTRTWWLLRRLELVRFHRSTKIPKPLIPSSCLGFDHTPTFFQTLFILGPSKPVHRQDSRPPSSKAVETRQGHRHPNLPPCKANLIPTTQSPPSDFNSCVFRENKQWRTHPHYSFGTAFTSSTTATVE